ETNEGAVVFPGPGRESRLIDVVTRAQHMGPVIINGRIAMRHGIRVEAAILVLLVLAAIAPFSNRAVFADEHIYLRLARSALERPLFPADTPLLFFGILRPNSIGHTHPPAVEYYLAGLYALFGKFSEVPFRLLFAVFPI